MKYEVKVPAVGESVTEATIGQWLKKNGEAVKRNEVLLLLETDKASVEVIAEQDGVLTVSVEQGQTVPIGSTVAVIDSEGKATAAPAAAKPTVPAAAPSAPSMTAATGGREIHADLKNHLSPAVQKIVTEKGLDPASVSGTGKDGRLTKEDVMKASPAVAAAAPLRAPAPAVDMTLRGPSKQGEQKRVAMNNIRKKIAERLVYSQQSTATLTTFNEIDMSRVMEIRNKYKDKFKERYGVSLGFMGFFVKATIEALKAWPAVNAFIDGTDMVYNNYYNVGVAVGTEKGLIVPVIRDADLMSVAQVEMAIRDYAIKARDGKISIDDLSGGTFTISNGGVYGSLMSTPILNPPQSGILGMHKIEERPMAINGKVEIRPMMYVALSYDHRIIDGKEAVSFLVKIKEGIEDPERLLIEI
ncbi:MAG: 2-oxoglutarate dehydrogenase complex dihydrolipoyllysine-residue succinyltransferase [Proteobacteria bacterium]|nr:2-oxoglutarate dehydrogenase complex dihydrolipoyllysine-residue succinyltransferase [Pseudomonadota bacterium]